ncbi:MAG: matrixin family metalloprotease [Phycisphaerales bacterium]|nr:matrixin family metalloprotease [Phycisphaerales bacterium]
MHQHCTALAIAGCLAILASTPLHAAVRSLTIADMTTEAEMIVLGDVVAAEPFWTDDHSLIKTRVDIAVDDTLLGDAAAVESVIVVGGEIDGLRLRSSNDPMFGVGQRVLLFVDAEDRIVGVNQGAFQTDGVSALQMPGSLCGQCDADAAPMLLQGLVDKINTALPAGVPPAALTPYDGDAVISTTLPYTVLGPTWAYMAEPMGEDYLINGNCADASAGPPQNQVSAIFLGGVEWSDAAADFEFSFGGITTSTADAFDGQNVIFFCPAGDCGMAPSTIAVTRVWSSGNDILEWDMIFNDEDHDFWDGLTGSCSGDMDIQAIATHEFGHALGLGHSADAGATMFASISTCSTGPRSINSDDEDGIGFLYGSAAVLPTGVYTGTGGGDRFAAAAASAGDVNRDGVADFIVGAPYNDDNHVNSGRVYVYSGNDGSLLYAPRGGHENNRLGWSVSTAGDTDGDGYDDFVAGAPYYADKKGRIKVFSGRTGSTLFTKKGAKAGDRFGWTVSGGIDVNNDGFDDVIVGAPYNDSGGSNAGRVYIYSGEDGSTLKKLNGQRSGDLFGYAVTAVGKMNSDAWGDFVIGAPKHDAGGSNAGRIYAYSGRTYDLLFLEDGHTKGDQFGRAVAAGGRITTDGRMDVIVGSPYHDKSGVSNRGRVDVFNGKTGSRLWAKTGSKANDRFGWSVGGGGDVNGDSRADVIIGAPFFDAGPSNVGRVYVRSGTNGASLATFTADGSGDHLGYAVAGIPDVDGDNEWEMLLGARNDDDAAGNAGKASLILSTAGFTLPIVVGDHGPPAPDDGDDGDDAATLPLHAPAADEEVIELLVAWLAGGEAADVDGDGMIDVDDLREILDLL